MKALIFAAGYGTRLRPLTDTVPKPLIEINGKTMLQRTLEMLSAVGADDFLINTHHLHGKIEDFLAKNNNFGLRITLSYEEGHPLETGGTLKANEAFFKGDGRNEPFFAVNGDILSGIDLSAMYKCHIQGRSLATLAIRKRPSSRQLMFDEKMRLIGRHGQIQSENGLSPYGFGGIQVISTSIFDMIKEEGVFSITEAYLRIARETGRISGFEDHAPYWFDIGSPEKLSAARNYFKENEL